MVNAILKLIDQHLKELTTGEAGPDAVGNGRIAVEDLKIHVEDMLEKVPNWERDDYQFPRLLAEITATQDKFDVDALCVSMDCVPGDINELFDRADVAWERVKEETCR